MELATCIAKLTTQFYSPFFEPPGPKYQYILSPNGREKLIKSHSAEYRQSAVMILIYLGKDKKAHTLFIKRNQYNGAHSGQISLPGGAYEESDQNLVQTAIRETQEEVGILVNDQNVFGQLTSLKIPVSGFEVTPIVAYINERPKFVKDNVEVSEIIEYPIEELISLPIELGEFNVNGKKYKIKAPFFALNQHRLWGATAMIISEFRHLLK